MHPRHPNEPTRTWRRWGADGARLITSALRVLAVTSTLILVMTLLAAMAHRWLSFCPLRMARLTDSNLVKVVYGYVSDFHGGIASPELEAQVRSGRVALGGCVRMPWTHICPYCSFPVR